MYNAYACPRTRAPLQLKDGKLVSGNGGTSYPLRNGIPNVLRHEPVEDDEALRRLHRLNALATRHDWRRALEDMCDGNPLGLRYVTDPARLRSLDALSLARSDVALEVGCSLGQFTATIAKRVKALYGLEVVQGQAEFCVERCRQEGCTNVSIACGGDDCHLPYRERTFDVAILNLVLEWCGSRNPEVALRASQMRILTEAFRVLRPGGRIFILTKNRFALRLLTGGRDEHAFEMRFGSALPRFLLRLLLRLRGKSGPQGLLHSHNGLKRMLLKTGFSQIISYWAAPEMRYPAAVVPTTVGSIRQARRQPGLVQSESRRIRLLMRFVPALFVKHVSPGLLFVATKPRETRG